MHPAQHTRVLTQFQNVDATSLIIVDELGRGTSSEEGVGICHAICEHLLATKVHAGLMTTHCLLP